MTGKVTALADVPAQRPSSLCSAAAEQMPVAASRLACALTARSLRCMHVYGTSSALPAYSCSHQLRATPRLLLAARSEAVDAPPSHTC